MNKDKEKKSWRNILIHHPESINFNAIDWSKSTVLISSYGSQENIYQNLLEKSVPKDVIYKLYEKIKVY